jgi:hypothetical protein
MRSLSFVQSASSKAERDRFRNMSNLQDEVLALAPADGELVVNDFKQFSPIFKAQKSRSKAGRVKLGDSEVSLRDNLKTMISKNEHRDQTPLELWSHFISLLRDLGCDPKEFTDSKKRPIRIEYDFPRSKKKRNFDGEPIRTMTIGRFRNLVSKLRNHVSRAAQ